MMSTMAKTITEPARQATGVAAAQSLHVDSELDNVNIAALHTELDREGVRYR
jgi:hypothetical protein